MSIQSVFISAPSRIHFGLLSPHDQAERRFGGAGVMVQTPRVELLARPSSTTRTSGILAPRALDFVHAWQEYTGLRLSVCVDVQAAPPEHVGLGVGTQLGMAVATALDVIGGRADTPAAERALSVRRGRRSAVGAYGFLQGGLIVERGKGAGQPLGQLIERIEPPRAWRVLLICLRGDVGLAGQVEQDAFEDLVPLSAELGRSLRDELFERLAPAARRGDFARFSAAVYRYGALAGECFAAQQGGTFASPEIARVVQWIRDAGVAGVGQSSWGPTLFCWFPDAASAHAFAAKFDRQFPQRTSRLVVTTVASKGARVVVQQ